MFVHFVNEAIPLNFAQTINNRRIPEKSKQSLQRMFIMSYRRSETREGDRKNNIITDIIRHGKKKQRHGVGFDRPSH